MKLRRVIVFSYITAAAVLGFLGFSRIGINPDLTGIAPQDRMYYREQLEFLKKKVVSNVLTVAIYTKGDVERAKTVLKDLKRRFEASGRISKTLRFDTPEIFIKYGIFSLQPGSLNTIMENFRNLKFLSQSVIDFKFWRNVGSVLGTLVGYLEDYSKRKGFNEYILVSPDGGMIIMNFALRVPVTDVKATSESMRDLIEIRDSLVKEYGFDIRFTGGPMGTYESNQQVKRDFALTTTFSLVSISLLLYITLGSAAIVGYLFLSMLVAMSISLGIFYFIFGEINIVTSFVNAMTLGLGVDYGIHLATRLSDKLSKGMEKNLAVSESLREIFFPSLISALTTASAFITLVFIKSPALIQMGIMSAVGTGVFFVTMIVFFPSAILGSRGNYRTIRGYDIVIRTVDLMRKDLKVISAVIISVAVLSYFGYQNLRVYWYTPPGLMDENSETARTFRDIKKRFENFGLGEVVIAVEKLEDVKKVVDDLKESELFSNITSLMDLVGNITQTRAEKVLGLYGNLVKVVNDPILSAIFRKVGMYQQIIEMLRVVRESRNFEAVVAELERDLPMFFYKSSSGKSYYLVYASPKFDLYVNNNIKTVFEYLSSRGYRTFGYPSLFYNVMRDIREYVWKAGFLIVLTVLVIILVSIRKFFLSLLTIALVIAATTATLGLVKFWNIHVSFMTLMIIPILVGIGIDGMVHVFHSAFHNSKNILKTEKAVSLSTLTTVLAFGSFVIARGQLLREFGISVSVGLIMSFILAVFVFLPVVERHRFRKGRERIG